MKKTYLIVLVILAIVSFGAAIVYVTHTAGNLPHFFLGYSAHSTHKHIKHAVAFIALGIVFLIAAWMMSGPKKAESTDSEPRD
jgi:FtsH-binding integral membrane protein